MYNERPTIDPETMDSPQERLTPPLTIISNRDTETDQTEPEKRARPASRRLVSLDAFRGLTVLGMLLVNNIALDTATPKQLTHADWNQGVQFADLVFPWFLLIVGVAIPFSDASARAKGVSWWSRAEKILRRAVMLVLLGCLIDSSLGKQPIFDLGVLQIIGLAYLIGALAYPLPALARGFLIAALLGAHGAILQFAAAPGCSPGIQAQTCNVVDYLNHRHLQPYHLSGLLSTVPTAALVLIGAAVGDLLRSARLVPIRKVASLIACGVVLAAIGWTWSHWLPMNKAVWSGSYILYTGGLGAIVLALFYALLDARGWSRFALPLVILGANPITAYVGPILLKAFILQSWTWQMADGSHLPLQQALLHGAIVRFGQFDGGLIYTAAYIGISWLFLAYLYHKKIFLRV